MGFSDSIKQEVRRKACYRCCICEKPRFLHIHHIIPSEESGPDTLENATALCVKCHDTYGHDKSKRKWIRERRDWWYGQCKNKINKGINVEILEQLNKIQDLLDYDIRNRSEIMKEHYITLRTKIQNQTNKLSQLISSLPSKFHTEEVKKLKIIEEELDVIKDISNLIGTLSLEYDPDFKLWKEISDYLFELNLTELIPHREFSEMNVVNGLNVYINKKFKDSISQIEHSAVEMADLIIKSKIAIECKILRLNMSKDQLIGQLTDILRISNIKFGIGFAIDMTREQQYVSLNGLYYGKNRNIILIIKPYNLNNQEIHGD